MAVLKLHSNTYPLGRGARGVPPEDVTLGRWQTMSIKEMIASITLNFKTDDN